MNGHPLATQPRQLARAIAVSHQRNDCLRADLDTIHEYATRAIGHLHCNPTGIPGHDRRLLPERLGHDQPKSLAHRRPS
jgi:hypothetical protein